MSFDLTNKNISDTFQNLMQRTGSDNQLYDLKGNPIGDLTITGSLHAQSYIVSQSITSVSSGSNIFGNSMDDVHIFSGSVISMSLAGAAGNASYGPGGINIFGTPGGTSDLGVNIGLTMSGSYSGYNFTGSANMGLDNLGRFIIENTINQNHTIGGDLILKTKNFTNAIFIDDQSNTVSIGDSAVSSQLLAGETLKVSGSAYLRGNLYTHDIYTSGSVNGINKVISSSGYVLTSSVQDFNTEVSRSAATFGFSGGGSVDVSGTPVDNQIAIWTDQDTLEGDSELRYSGSQLLVDGDISASGDFYFSGSNSIGAGGSIWSVHKIHQKQSTHTSNGGAIDLGMGKGYLGINSVYDSGTNNTQFGSLLGKGLRIYGGNIPEIANWPSIDVKGWTYWTLQATGSNIAKIATTQFLVNPDNSATIDFQVGGSTNDYLIFADSSTNRVGVNSISPSRELTVEGAISASGDLYIGSSIGSYISASQGTLEISGSGTAVLDVDGNITASGFIKTDSHITASGDISASGTGIFNRLEVHGTDGTLQTDYIIHKGDADTKFGFPTNDKFKIRTAGTDRYVVDTTHTFTGNITTDSHITASGNISASGTINEFGGIVTENITVNNLNVTASNGYHGSQTRIKILPRDFIPDDDTGRAAMVEEDTPDNLYLRAHSACSFFASVDIPTGFKATGCRVYGADTSNTVSCSEAFINSPTYASWSAGVVGTEFPFTHITSSDTNFLWVAVNVLANDDYIYGGYVNIEKI